MSIKKRRYERKQLNLRAVMTVGKDSYSCVIQNLSLYGAYIKADLLGTSVEFYADTSAELKYQIPTGEILNLNGEIKWTRVDSSGPDHFVHHIGIEIMTPPAEFIEFVSTLS